MAHSIRPYLETKTAFPSGFSPDGTKLLVGSDLTGSRQLYVVPTAGGELRQVTAFDEPVGGRYLPTSDELLVQVDEGGNERHQLHRMADDGTGLRPVVHDPAHIHRLGGVTRDGTRIAYSTDRRTGRDFDVWVHDLATGEERLVFDLGGWCSGAGFSPDGRWLGVHRLTERNGDSDVYLVDLVEGEVVHVTPHEEEAEFGTPSWLPDGSGFLFSTDQDRQFAAIARYDLADRRWEVVLERPWDAGCAVDWTGRHLLVVTNEDGSSRAELLDPVTLDARGDVPLPGVGIAGPFAFSHDGRSLAFGFSSPVEPGDTWVLDTVTGATTRLTESPTELDRRSMVVPERHRFTSFDGEQVPIYSYRPPRPLSEPPPVVVLIHGGPESQYVPSFSPVVQYLVAQGFGVVAPNVRGSTGYGKRWQHLDDVRKRLDSVRDLASLHDWLGAEGGFDAGRAVLYGGSYGGYMVLAGLAFQPERWAAGIDIVGIANLVTFLEHTAPWRRRFREREYGSLEHDREFLVEASPITHVDAIRAPLFVIHGANDPRVPLGEAEQIHAALTAKGVPCELLVYGDEGHGLAKLPNRLDAYPRAVEWLDRVLGLDPAAADLQSGTGTVGAAPAAPAAEEA